MGEIGGGGGWARESGSSGREWREWLGEGERWRLVGVRGESGRGISEAGRESVGVGGRELTEEKEKMELGSISEESRSERWIDGEEGEGLGGVPADEVGGWGGVAGSSWGEDGWERELAVSGEAFFRRSCRGIRE